MFTVWLLLPIAGRQGGRPPFRGPWACCGLHEVPPRVVGEPQAELLVGTGHLGGFGIAQIPGDVRTHFDQGLDLVAGESGRAGGRLAKLGLGGEPLGLGQGDPFADLLGVAAGVEGGPVAGHASAYSAGNRHR
jgi:hypothetical protein